MKKILLVVALGSVVVLSGCAANSGFVKNMTAGKDMFMNTAFSCKTEDKPKGMHTLVRGKVTAASDISLIVEVDGKEVTYPMAKEVRECGGDFLEKSVTLHIVNPTETSPNVAKNTVWKITVDTAAKK